MKREQFSDALNELDDDLIEQTAAARHKRPRRKQWQRVTAIAACVCLLIGGAVTAWKLTGAPVSLPGAVEQGGVHLLAAAVYPQMSPCPDFTQMAADGAPLTAEQEAEFNRKYEKWVADQQALEQPTDYANGLEPFFTAGMQQLLGNANQDNKVCSPLNLYMALAMLAETADGSSRQQILSALGVADMDALRQQAASVWKANYSNDGSVTNILANSIWLNDGMDYRQETLDTLAQTYYASSYQGEMGSQALNTELRSWLNEQTGGLLKDQVNQQELSAQTVLALMSTVNYQSKWLPMDEFDKNATASGSFHGSTGEQTCDFMHSNNAQTYFWADHFSSIYRMLGEGYKMWFILPDEGVTAESLFSDPQLSQFLFQNEQWDNRKELIVNFAVPKFDVSSDTQLSEGLQSMGITDIFDPQAADFSALSPEAKGVWLDKATHTARVMIDEEGCTATAITAMVGAGAGMPPTETVDFVLDRPFLFVITNKDSLPLFAGVVNHPVQN